MSRWLDALRSRLGALLHKGRTESELAEELAFHLERQTEENLRAGMTPAAAGRAARLALGGVEQVKERVRDERGVRALEDLLQDLRYGVRALAKAPAYTAIIVLTLALGIGANSAIFSIIDAVLLRPLPYGDGERLVHLRQQRRLLADEDMRFSVHEIEDYRQQNRVFDGLAEYHDMTFTLLGRGEPERVRTGVVNADFFRIMGLQPILGRGFTDADEAAGAEPVLVLSYGYWQRRFGGDPAIVGQTFEMNDKVHTVVGVLPPVPQFPRDNDLYMPTSACPTRSSASFIANRNARMMRAFGRLKPGTSLAQAAADLGGLAHRIATEHPEAYPAAWGYGVTAVPLREELVYRARPTFLLLLGVAGLVLVIACANVASLVLARLGRREQELAVRTALGAGKGRLLRQLLTESSLLALAGGGVGLLVAYLGHDLLVSFAARFTPRAAETTLDGTVLLFTLGLALATGLVVGALPALASRPELSASLGEGRGHSARRRKRRLQQALVVAQLAVAFLLLMGAGLLLRSFLAVLEVDPGYRPERVLTLSLDLPNRYFKTPEGQDEFFAPLSERIAALPEVRSVARATLVPMEDPGFTTGLEIEDRPTPAGSERQLADFEVVSRGYFQTLGIPLLAGRTFDADDRRDGAPVAVVSRSLARRQFPGGAVGKRIARCSINTGQCGEMQTIVGVVGDIHHAGLDADPPDLAYLPAEQASYGGQDLLIRTSGEPLAIAERVKGLIHAAEPATPVSDVRTLVEIRDDSLAQRRLSAVLVLLFSALALVVTLAGVIGVVAYSVSERRREISIRMALGAERRTVLSMVLSQGLVLTLAGLALGLAASLAVGRVLAGQLWGITPTDPATLLAVSLFFLAAAWLATYVPARRAATVDPVTILHG
jgi:putative ABC transport system permease protein